MFIIEDIWNVKYLMPNMNSPTSLRQLGSELRQRRVARGLTQAQLASEARLSRAVVIRAEKGDPTVALGNMARLLHATGAELRVESTRLPMLEEVAALFPDE